MRRMLQVFLIVLLVASLIVLTSAPPVMEAEATGENWLTGWTYRKSHVIQSASGAGTNYQIRITVHYGSGTDSGEHVYLNNKSRTDFGDIRFTDDDGSTLLDYWMESKTDGDQAVFWVEVADNLTASDATIYIYYGKSDAATVSNGTATFILFDDFEDDTLNQPPEGWIEDESQRTGQYWVQNSIVHSGNKALRLDMEPNYASGYYYVLSPAMGNITYNVKITFYARLDTLQKAVFYTSGDGGTIYGIQFANPTADDKQYRSDGTWVTSGTYAADTWYKNEFVLNFNSKTYAWYWNDAQQVSDASFVNSAGKLDRLKFGSHFDQIMYVDDVRVRKYVSPEPQHGSWGTEENNAVIGDFEAPSPVSPDEYFLLNATIIAPSSVTEFINATVELEGGIILKWDNSTDSFTEYQDTNGYCTLDASGSFKTQLNSTSYKLSWRIKLSSSFQKGYTDVVDADVYTSNRHGQNSQSSLFYFTTYNGWWNTNWQKRKPINVTENSGATLTNYAVAMNVTYDDDMQPDFDDLRFTIYDSTVYDEVKLDYYIESKSDGSWAYVWVEIPKIPANNNATIYMYYGNSSVTSESNASATFIFWDDFEQDRGWEYGESKDGFYGTYPSTSQYYSPTKSYEIGLPSDTATASGDYCQISKAITFDGSQVKIEVRVKDSRDGSAANYHYKKVKLGSTQLWSSDAGSDTNEWQLVSVTTTPAAGTKNLILQLYEQHGVSSYSISVWWDDVKVRKYVSPEPSVTFGSEESPESPAQNLIVTGCYFSTGQQITVKGYIYYEGTTTPPSESVTVYAKYGSVKASTSSLTNGLFTLNWTESSAGLRTYTIYAVAASDGRVSVQNQTLQAFSFFVDGQFRWGFSNDTIASFSWDDAQKRLNVTFSSPANSTLYVYGRPTYILGETFDLGTDYSAGWTQLNLNQTTSVVLAHPNWGDFYVHKLTAGEVTDAYWTDQVFTLELNGTSGTTATLEIYCGSRGMPKSISGFTGEVEYDADTTILSGTVTYQSPVTITLDYTIPTSSGSAGGGGSSSSAGLSILPTISLSIAPARLIQLRPGETVTGRLSMNFTGVNNIRVISLEFSGAAADWITLAEPMPKTIFKPIGEEVGAGEIELRIVAPKNAEPGDYTVPVLVKAEAVGSQIQANGYLTFRITPQTPPVSIVPEYMTWIFATAIIAIIIYAYLKD